MTEHVNIERVKASASNQTFIGGDDVLLYFEFPEKWEVEFSTRYMHAKDKIWIDMSYEQAIEFALAILEAAKGSKRIHDDYAAYQKEQDENDS